MRGLVLILFALACITCAACIQETNKGADVFPRPIRLNNPGAIRHSETHTWRGEAKFQDDKSFVRFDTPVHGVRALMKILITYDTKYGINTINRIIYRWAPPSENNTESYISDVSYRTGISPDAVLDMQDIDTLILLAKAIIRHENGVPPEQLPFYWYPEYLYHEAALMALGRA